MKRIILWASLLALFANESPAQWKPAGDRIKTEWAAKVDPANPLPEYPRPIMQRAEWQHLNGLWNYALIERGDALPETWEGKILVPFAIESSLSGVMREVGEKKELVYQRTFNVPAAWRSRRVLLHFGAVDWKADVWEIGRAHV